MIQAAIAACSSAVLCVHITGESVLETIQAHASASGSGGRVKGHRISHIYCLPLSSEL